MDAGDLSILRARIILHEGISLHAYRDSRGYITQGVGHLLTTDKTIDPAAYPDITLETAMGWLEADIAAAQEHAELAVLWYGKLNGARQGVVVEMVFQMGSIRVMAFHKMIAAFHDGAFETAADEMLDSAWHDETPARCEALAEIMKTGEASLPLVA